MYQNEVPQFFSAPGKVFILGEYAVLAGSQAVVATVGPRFKLSVSQISAHTTEESRTPHSSQPPFAPQSPAGRLLDWFHHCGLPELQFQFEDPFNGEGGFGASSAQFALAYFAMSHLTDWERRWEKVWKLYRELNSRPGVSPSGADLVAQWRGGCTLFDPDKTHCLDLWPMMNWSDLLVFSATSQNPERKVATHDHLAKLSENRNPLTEKKWMLELKKTLQDGINAIRAGKPESLGKSMQEYADLLWEEGLETKATHEDRLALSSMPDVFGVKGVGAMQSDALLVLQRGTTASRKLLIETAEERGLTLVSEGLTAEMGVRAHHA